MGTGFKNNREKRKGLNSLEGQLKEEIFNVENIINKIDIAIGEIESAKALFEQAQKTLDKAIINRLEKAKHS
ncbi:P12 family lipoprotein [Borrelia turicatae]|uniref:P12 family lipoprotein n=1 Tax=Borrelia TaxID=138 RepID=UPI0039BC5894